MIGAADWRADVQRKAGALDVAPRQRELGRKRGAHWAGRRVDADLRVDELDRRDPPSDRRRGNGGVPGGLKPHAADRDSVVRADDGEAGTQESGGVDPSKRQAHRGVDKGQLADRDGAVIQRDVADRQSGQIQSVDREGDRAQARLSKEAPGGDPRQIKAVEPQQSADGDERGRARQAHAPKKSGFGDVCADDEASFLILSARNSPDRQKFLIIRSLVGAGESWPRGRTTETAFPVPDACPYPPGICERHRPSTLRGSANARLTRSEAEC
ncbi:MAG: hypothetical protein ACOVVK_01460 [Elsteraceae bacterium]